MDKLEEVAVMLSPDEVPASRPAGQPKRLDIWGRIPYYAGIAAGCLVELLAG